MTRATACESSATAPSTRSQCSASVWGTKRSPRPSAVRSSPHPYWCTDAPALVVHEGRGVFAGAPSPLIAGRYHSLVVDEGTLPEEFEVTARSEGLIMGMRHRTLASRACSSIPSPC